MKRSHYLLKCKLWQIILFLVPISFVTVIGRFLPPLSNRHSLRPFSFFKRTIYIWRQISSELRLWPLLQMTGPRRRPSVSWTEAELSWNERKRTGVPARLRWRASLAKEAGREMMVPESFPRVSFPPPGLAYHAADSLTLCVLSKREYPGFSWIYFKVNQIIAFSLIANSLIWIFVKWVCRIVRFCYLALSASCAPPTPPLLISWRGLLSVNAVAFFCLSLSGKPASRLSHQPHRHRTGYWIPHGRGLSV